MLRSRRLLPLLVAPVIAGAVLVGGASAIEPPAEVRHVCVDRKGLVSHAVSAAVCGRDETAFQLPRDRPFHVCAEIRAGALRRVTSPSACNLTKERASTVPDSGAVYACAGNVQGGTVLPRGRLRRVDDASQCDARSETPMVTPAAPDAVADTFSIGEDALLDVPARGVLINDRDITGAPLIAHLVSGVTVGSLDLRSDGSLAYDPRTRFDHLDEGERAFQTFRYTADDGELVSAPATATIAIVGRNDAPVARPDAYEVGEDDVLRVPAAGVLGNDTDAEDHPLAALLVSDVLRGALALSSDGGVVYDPAGAFDDLDSGEEAIVSFTYLARDGSADSGVARATITVRGENDPPVAVDDGLSTDENTVLRVPAPGLLGNDADAEGQELSAIVVSGPSRGSLDLEPDGSLVFDPRADFDGLAEGQTEAATFTYRTVDASGGQSAPATVTIGVSGISPPTAVTDLRDGDEDHAIAVDVLANDALRGGRITDVHTTRGTATLGAGGVVTFDPRGAFDDLRPGQTAAGHVDYTLVNDEGSSSAAIRVTVAGRNDAPTADADSYPATEDGTLSVSAPGVLEGDTDPDDASLTAVLVAPPSRGRVDLRSDGSFDFHPSGDLGEGESQDVTFGYRARDGVAESATATVTIRLSGVNDPPAIEDQRFAVDEGAAAGTPVGTVAASDPDGTAGLGFEITGQTPAGALAIDPQTGELTVADASLLDAETAPVLTLQVRVTDDGGLTDTATVRVDVRGVDEAPEPGDDTYRAVGNTELAAGGAAPQSPAFRSDARNVLANDGDPDGGGLSVVPASGQTHPLGLSRPAGRYSIAADGGFTYHPPRGYTGADQFTYEVTDGSQRRTATVRVTVAERVWYVDDTRPAPGDGTSSSPYADLGSVAAAATDTEDADDLGDTIYLFTGSGTYSDPVALEDEQRLTGQGVALVLDGATLVPAGTAPRVSTSGAPAVTLATDNVLRGLSLAASGATALDGDGFGTLTADLPELRAQSGAAADLADGTLVARFGTVSSTGASASGLALDGVAGALQVPGATAIDGATGPALKVTGGSADVTLSSGSLSGANGGVRVAGGSGRLDVGATISTTGGRSVWVSGVTAPASGCAVALRGAVTDTGQGILLDANGTGARTCFSGRLTLQTGAATAFEARDGGSASATGAASTITTTTGVGLDLQDVAIGSGGLSLRTVATDGAPHGIVADGVTGGPLAVTGSGTPDSGGIVRGATDSGIVLTDVSDVALAGMRITQSLGHGMELTRASRVGLRQMVVEDAAGDALHGATVRDLTIRQGSILQRSRRHALYVTDLLGSSSLAESVLRSSRGAAHVRVVNTSASTPRPGSPTDVLKLEAMRFEDSTDTFVDVEAGTGSNLQLLVGTPAAGTPNFLRDGAEGVRGRAMNGGRLDVDVTKLSRTGGTGDAITLAAKGASAGGTEALLTFDIFDNNRDRGGSISNAGGAAVRLVAEAGADMRGTVLNNELAQPRGTGVVARALGGDLEAEIGSNQILAPGCVTGDLFTDRCTTTASCPTVSTPMPGGVDLDATAGGTLAATLRSNEVTDPLGDGIVADVDGADAAVVLAGNRVVQQRSCSLRATTVFTPSGPVITDTSRPIGGRSFNGSLDVSGGGNTVDLLDSSPSSGIVLGAGGTGGTTAALTADLLLDGDDGVQAAAGGTATIDLDVARLTREGGTGDAVDVSGSGSGASVTLTDSDEAHAAGIRSVGGSALEAAGDVDVTVDGVDVDDAGEDAVSVASSAPGSVRVAGTEVGGTLGGSGIAVSGSAGALNVDLTGNVVAPDEGGAAGVAVTSTGTADICLTMANNRSVVTDQMGFELRNGLEPDGSTALLRLLGRSPGEAVSAWSTRNGNTGSIGSLGGIGTC